MIDGFKHHPITLGLIALNLMLFGITALQSDPFRSQSLIDLGATYGWAIGAQGEWWRVVTGMFLHGGMTHILLNMISLYIVGRIAEELFSRGDYLLLYLVTGIVGATVSVAVHPEGLSVGASGAIFGIFGAIAGYALAHRHVLGDRFHRFVREFGGVLALNLVLGFSIPGIDMSAHIGGLISGLVGGYVAQYRYAIWIGSGVLLVGVWTYLVLYLPGQFVTQGLVG
jgi:rhomboid protease GluP